MSLFSHTTFRRTARPARAARVSRSTAIMEALETRAMMAATPGVDLCVDLPKTCGCGSGGKIAFGSLAVTVDYDGNVSVQMYQDTSITDNSYGSNGVGWAGGHKFTDMINNDYAEFKFTDSKGALVLDIKIDYLSLVGANAAHPSGYASTYSMVKGSAANVMFVDTSMDDNLNNIAFNNGGNITNVGVDHVNLTQNSPKLLDTKYTPKDGANFALWNFNSRYSVDVAKGAFGSAGFGGVTVIVHESPSKQCVTDFQPVVCQTCGSTGGGTTCGQPTCGQTTCGQPKDCTSGWDSRCDYSWSNCGYSSGSQNYCSYACYSSQPCKPSSNDCRSWNYCSSSCSNQWDTGSCGGWGGSYGGYNSRGCW